MRKLLYFLPFHFTLFLILVICVQYYFRIWQFDFKVLAIIHLLFLGIILFINFRKSVTFLTFGYFFLLEFRLFLFRKTPIIPIITSVFLQTI